MTANRIIGTTCVDPFPIYPDLSDALTTAHAATPELRDPTVAHVLGTCAGYAYADTDTVSTMMTRLGLPRHACVRITETVDAMLIFSTVYLVQSECGRVAIVGFRGTEPARLGNWLGNADIGGDSTPLSLCDGAQKVRVHAGFHRNVRATSWAVLQELKAAIDGRSLANHDARVEHPLEALYITGHSLGGAMAVLFALTVCGTSAHRPIAERLRAVYTFGQPMAIAGPLPGVGKNVASRLFRHVVPHDPIPALPPAAYGPFVHVGREYRLVSGDWQRSDTAVEQMPSIKALPRSLLPFFTPEKARRRSFRYSVAHHAPDYYIAALRPPDRVTEFGDRG
jgi:hypothetical protein